MTCHTQSKWAISAQHNNATLKYFYGIRSSPLVDGQGQDESLRSTQVPTYLPTYLIGTPTYYQRDVIGNKILLTLLTPFPGESRPAVAFEEADLVLARAPVETSRRGEVVGVIWKIRIIINWPLGGRRWTNTIKLILPQNNCRNTTTRL